MILALGLDVIFTDVDVVWCADAVRRMREIMLSLAESKIVIQNDNPREGMRGKRMNSRFYYVRAEEMRLANAGNTVS